MLTTDRERQNKKERPEEGIHENIFLSENILIDSSVRAVFFKIGGAGLWISSERKFVCMGSV